MEAEDAYPDIYDPDKFDLYDDEGSEIPPGYHYTVEERLNPDGEFE